MALRAKTIRKISQQHATRLPRRFRLTGEEPDYGHRGVKTPEQLVAHAIFLFREASRLEFKGYLLRATHVFGFAEALTYAAGVFSIEDLRRMRPNGQSGSRNGPRARLRRVLYKVGDWFLQVADRL